MLSHIPGGDIVRNQRPRKAMAAVSCAAIVTLALAACSSSGSSSGSSGSVATCGRLAGLQHDRPGTGESDDVARDSR